MFLKEGQQHDVNQFSQVLYEVMTNKNHDYKRSIKLKQMGKHI